MAEHRDADVYRWDVVQRMAREHLAGKAPSGPRVERRGPPGREVEVRTASAKRDGVEAMLAMARRAS